MHWSRREGFTLVELVMVILLLAVLAAVAIPNFIDFRSDAKNSATQGAVGALRSVMVVAITAIQLKEDPTVPTPKYPILIELQGNRFHGSHPVLSGVSLLEAASGIPKNPWTLSTTLSAFHNSVINCNVAKTLIFSTTGQDFRGWCYKETSGEVWANSNLNGGVSGKTENIY